VKIKSWRTVILAMVGVAVLGGVVFLAALIVPGTPSRGASLKFEGYVPLPSHSMLSVLDYLTVSDRNLFVTNASTGAVYRIALRDGRLPAPADVSELPSGGNSHGVVIDPTSRLAYVTRSEVDVVDVFDPGTMRILKRIRVAADPDALAYDARNKLFYAANGDSNVGTVIDPQGQSMVDTIPLGGHPEFVVFDPDSGVLYQNIEDNDSIEVLDLAKRVMVDRWSIAPCHAPTGMALDSRRHRLFVGCKDNALLAVVGIGERRVLETVPIASGVDSVAFDPELQRIYTTGRSGTLVVVQQTSSGTYRTLDKLALHYGAHTLAVDPRTHALYVGYAGLFVQPRVAFFSAR
jgi:YVTN family beta-propeller protein